MEYNELTKRLLTEGYSKEHPPEGYLPWNDFYGGWQYSRQQMHSITISTPCGLVGNADRILGHGRSSYGGIEWCLENDNAEIRCPLERKTCDLVPPALAPLFERFAQCNTHIVKDSSDMLPHGDIEAEREKRRKEDATVIEQYLQAHPRACAYQMRYDRRSGEIHTWFNPQECARYPCEYCRMLDKPTSDKKGNVYYDLSITTKTPDVGLIPGELRTVKRKGVKYFDGSVRMDIAERVTLEMVMERVRHNRDIQQGEHFRDYHGQHFEWSVSNVIAASRETRDLEQDLKDIADGISVIHESDSAKAAKQAKRERSQARKAVKRRQVIDAMASGDVSDLDKYRFEKMLRKGEVSHQDVRVARQRKQPEAEQLSLLQEGKQ